MKNGRPILYLSNFSTENFRPFSMIFKSPSSLERELDGIRDSIRVFMGKVATFWRIEDFPVDCQRHIGKATENHIFRQILRPLADRFHGDLSRFQRRVTVDTSARTF